MQKVNAPQGEARLAAASLEKRMEALERGQRRLKAMCAALLAIAFLGWVQAGNAARDSMSTRSGTVLRTPVLVLDEGGKRVARIDHGPDTANANAPSNQLT